MANWAVFVTGMTILGLGLVLFLGSFSVVDNNHQWLPVGFGLFISGIFSIILGAFVIYRSTN